MVVHWSILNYILSSDELSAIVLANKFVLSLGKPSFFGVWAFVMLCQQSCITPNEKIYFPENIKVAYRQLNLNLR